MTLAPSGIDVSLCDGDLTINTVATRGPGWWLVSVVPAYRYGDRGGSNVALPGSNGERPYRRRRRGSTFQFRMVFGGKYTPAGVHAPVPGQQMWANLLTFTTAVVADPGGNGTVPSVLTTPDFVTHPADVQVLDLEPGDSAVDDLDAVLLATLTVRVPRGGWIL